MRILPQTSISKDRLAINDHPSHDVYQDQMFIKEIYKALISSPQWNKTLLVITYDEHGGFYDHVATPKSGVSSPNGVIGQEPFNFQFDRLGVRVPTSMVSPWIEKGIVVHGSNGVPFPTSEFEHSSISASIRKIFGLTSPFLTKRYGWAGSFEGIVQTRTDPKQIVQLSEFQQELSELTSVLNGDIHLQNFKEKVIKHMNVTEGIDYMENVVNRFFEVGYYTAKLGVSGEHIVEMRPSLTTRPKSSAP